MIRSPHVIRKLTGAGLLACALLIGTASPALAGLPCRTTQKNNLRALTAAATNSSLRYIHTTWFSQKYRYTTVIDTTSTAVAPAGSGVTTAAPMIELLVPAGGFSTGEVPIRNQAMAMYATSIALRNGFFDSARVRISKADALRRTVAWTNGLAVSYGRDHWSKWQSALWVYYLGFGAKQQWSSLPATTRERVTNAVAAEADYLLTVPPPYYRSGSGKILHPGDSKSEENAWNGALLIFAAREFPGNPHAAAWESQGRWYAVTSYATPSQVGHDRRIQGSNLNSDGTVINHGKTNPDYMFTQAEFIAKHAIVAKDTGTSFDKECANNLGEVWRALTRRRFVPPLFARPGGTVFRRDSRKRPSADVYYLQGADWTKVGRVNAAQMDIEAFASRIDSESYWWARAHLLKVRAQQSRHSDGSIFSARESYFREAETLSAASEAEMTLRLMEMR